jgi:deoxyhypusine synthase
MQKNHVVVYSDATVAGPLLFAHALSTRKKRKPRRLFQRLPEMYAALQKAHARKHPGSGAMPEVRKSAKTKTVGPGRVLPRR